MSELMDNLYERPTGEILDEYTIAELGELRRRVLASELSQRGIVLSDIEEGISVDQATNRGQ